MGKILDAVLNYKPGNAFYIVGMLLVFFGGIVFVQYRTQGEVNLARLVGADTPNNPFWERNPHLENVDFYPKTTLYKLRDRNSGATAVIDLQSLDTAEMKLRPCELAELPQRADYPGADGKVCFGITKPDSGSGHLYIAAVSFTAKAKATQVADFYRALFKARGYRAAAILNDPGRAIVVEAQDESINTVARISVRSSGDTAYGFLAWEKDFRP